MAKEVLERSVFEETINTHSEQWGQAFVTSLEQKRLFEYHRQLMSELTLDSHTVWGIIRGALETNTLPPINSVSLAEFMEAAIAHGCPVAFPLYQERDNPALIVRSYLTKNQAYRYIRRVLRTNEKPLLSQWTGAETKTYKDRGIKELIRPVEIDASRLHGIEKVAVYWPCQLLRILNGVAEGWDKAGFTEVDPKAFQIGWDQYNDSITNSENLESLAVSLATKTVAILKERGLNDSVIVQILLKSYDPVGPLNEHGQLGKISRIWRELIGALRIEPEHSGLVDRLTVSVEQKIGDWEKLNRPKRS